MTEQTSAAQPVRARIGVLTSGGDAQGMNAAVRAVVRTGIPVSYTHLDVYKRQPPVA